MTELDYSVLDPLEPLDENKGVDYSVLEPLTPETRAKDKQQKDIAELTARKEALEGRIATVKDTPVPKPTSEMSALGWSNVPRMGGLETSLQKTQSELSEAENRDIFWDTVMFDDFKHDGRTIKALKESLDNVSRNPSPNLEPDKHYHNTERLNKIAKHYENEDEQSQVYRHFTEEELFDEKTRQKRFAELGLDDRAMADQIRGLLGNFEEAGLNIPVDKALATTVVNSVLDNMFKERVLELAKVPFAYDGEGNVQGKTGFGRSVRLNRQILDGEDYVEPTWGNLIKAGFKSVFYPLAGQNQAQAEYDRQLSELAQGKDVRITQYVSVPAGGVGGGMAGVQKVVDPKTWGDKMWLDFARTHNLMDAWEGIPKDASPEDKYAAMQQAAGKELYRKQQNRENAEEIMRITGTHPIRSGFGEAWGSLGWTLQFALGGAVVGQTAMKGAQEQSDRLLTAKFNEDGSVQYEEDSFDRAFTKGLLNASVETASEFTSEVIWDAMFKALFSKLPGTDVLAKNVTKQMVKRSSGRAILRTARQMAAMGKAVHRGGVLSEHMEEVTAGFFNALFNYEMLDSEALATGSTVGGRVREFFTPENQLQTLEQVGYTTLLLGAVGLPIGGAQAAIGEYKANNALRSTLRHLGMDLQASEALLDRDLSTQIQATFNELGRRVKEGEKLDPVISTYLMAYYGASKDVLKNMSARERNDYLAKRLQEKSVIDDNNARALLHETGVKPEVTEKMNSEELQEAVLDVLGTLKNGLGEETLARILEEAGIDPKAIPDNIAGKVKLAREIITSGQFRVLQIETRKFDKAMQLEAQRMADAQAWAIQSEENSKATFEGDLTPLLESPLENPVVSDDNVTIFLDPENNRYVVSNKITGRDDMVFVPFTPDQKADAKALQEAADRQARIADVARETLNRRESIIQTAAGNLLRNGEKVTLVDNTEQAQRYLESKGIDKPVTGRVPGLTLKGENEILLIRDNISSSMLLMETLLHERFHLALDNLGITNEQFAKFVAKATGLNEKEILEDAEKIRKTYSKQGVKLDLNQAIEEAVAHKLETGQLLFEPSLWRYLGDKALGIKSHKISNDLGRVLAGLDNIQSKFNKGWEADSAPLEEQGEAEQETQQPETEQGTEQEKPEATPEAAPETAPQEKISPKERDMLGMLSQVGLTKNDLDRAKLNKDQVAELLNTIEQWLEDGDNAPLDAILERFDLPRPEIQEKGEDAQDATPDAPVEEKTDQEAQSETETEPETVETEQEPAPEKEPEESKPEEKEPEPEPREPSITIKDLAKLGEDAKNGDKEAHKKLVELLGEDNAVILQGDVVDYDTATQEQLKDAEETGKVINDFPLSEVHFDPDRFQFRYIYGEKGASGALEGIKKYDKKQGGTLWLWRDPKDGKAYVVNGHNRGAAAIRLGVTHHNVAFFQAKSDGEARRMGAEMNIREGNGSALDAAKFFRETKMTLEDFEALNIPMRQSMGKRGYALAQLVESLFRKVVSGEIDESVGVAIGENLPDLNAQVQLMEYLKKQRKRDLTIGVVAEIAKIANVAVEKETKEGGAEQIDLFGEEVGRNKLILETAQVRAEIARRLGRDKRLFGMVSKLTNKERLEQEGNLIDAETGKAISQEAGLILNLFHILKETDLVKVIEQAAQEVANGTGISKAVGDIMGEVKTTVLTAIGREVEGVEQTGDDIPSSGGDVQKPSETGTATPREDLTLDALTPEQEKAEQEKIKEQKRKRAEREEIEKRTAAPLKGDSGDLTSTLPSMEGTSDAPLFTENDRIGEQEKGGEKAEPAKTPDKQPEPAEPQKPTARTEFIARGTKVVGKDTDGVAYSGEIEAYNAADDTYTLNVLKVKQPGKAMLPLPIDMKTGNRQVLKKNLPADSVNPIDVDKGPSKLTEAEKRKLRIMDAARDSEIGADIDESISERLERVGGEEVQTPGDKDAAKYGNKSVTDNEIRFKITSPVEERGQLVAVHNLGIKQLEAVVNELGGFAMPSVAVTKPEIGHTEFGEVSVLFGKDTIDPAKSSYNKIYSGDAYTPSFPEVGVKMNEKAVIAVERRLSPLAKGNRMLNGTLHGMEDDIRRAGSPVEAYQYSPEMYALYAADRHGVEITPEMDMNALRSIRSDNPSYEDGYLGWLDETFKGTIVKKGFRNSKGTFAPSGARRSFEATHDPMTLANAVKIMRKKQQSGGQGGFFDTSVIGAARQPFKNIVQVKQAADQLTSIDDAEFNAQKREVTDQWFDLASALDKENGFQGGFGGVTPVDIANAIAKSHDNPIRIRTFLRNLGYNKVSSELANDIAQLARDAAKVPTRYYEAKPARGVGLEEAKAVILPDSAPKSLVDALQKRGTYLEFYKADDKADRIRVLNQVADTVDNVRFKITPEGRELALQQFKDTEKKYGGQAAFEKARKDGKTVLNYRQWVQVRTPAFLEWFGDWMHDPENASKVVNPETGEPLVVYHGTGADFSEFDPLKIATVTDDGWFGKGFYFSPDPKVANQYAAQGAPNIMPAYLKVENPYDWRANDGRGMSVATNEERYAKTRQIKEAGYDGVFVYDEVIVLDENESLTDAQWLAIVKHFTSEGIGVPREMVEEGLRSNRRPKGDYVRYYGADFANMMPTHRILREVVAFRPEQIKSAIANIGSFSDQTDDVRFKITPEERELAGNVAEALSAITGVMFKITDPEAHLAQLQKQAAALRAIKRNTYKKAFGERGADALLKYVSGIADTDSFTPQQVIDYVNERWGMKKQLADVVTNHGDFFEKDFLRWVLKEQSEQKDTTPPRNAEDLLAEVGYQMSVETDLDHARAVYLPYYRGGDIDSGGEGICTLREGSGRFKDSYVAFFVQNNAKNIPHAVDLTQDNITPEWAAYLEKQGRKNEDGTYNLEGLRPEKLDPYSTSVMSVQISKSGNTLKCISRYNHTIEAPDNIYRDLDDIRAGLHDAFYRRFGREAGQGQRDMLPDSIQQTRDNKLFKFTHEKNGVYFGDQFYIENGQAVIMDMNTQRLIDDTVFNANGEIKRVWVGANGTEDVAYRHFGRPKRIEFGKKGVVRLIGTEKAGDVEFTVKEGKSRQGFKMDKAFRRRMLSLAYDARDVEGGLELSGISDGMIHAFWGEDIVAVRGDAYFGRTQITDLLNLKHISGEGNFRYSSVTDLGKLTTIGGNAYFSGSLVTSLGNLTSIGGTVSFAYSSVTDLGKLTTIGGDAIFSNRSITDLGKLRSIGGNAYFDNSSITDLGNLRSIGETVFYFRNEFNPARPAQLIEVGYAGNDNYANWFKIREKDSGAQDSGVRYKITPEVDAQQRDWAWKYRNGILPIEDKRAAEAIIDRINAARGLPDVVYHGSPTAAGLMKSGGFDVGKRGDLTRAPSARLADFFAGNKGTSAIYAALELSEPMFGPWGTQPQNMNEVLGAVDDMVFGATYSGNRTQGDGSVQSSNPVFWNAYGEYIENVMAAKTAEQRRDLTIDFLNAEDPELRDSMIDAYEEELDRYTENSEQEAAEELYGDDIGDAWREDDDKRDEVYERAREYATNMVDAPKFLTRAPVTEKDLNISQFEWNPDNLPGTEGIERFAIDASKLKRIEYNKEGRNPTGSFAEHLEKAKQEGYEGVAFVDVKDGAGFDTVYALFENATRKSANPFTYDDKGELIPFSERAGDPTKDDIRYKITGDEVAAMWPDYFEDQEQRERLQALRGEREKFYSHENREITGIALDSSKATTEDFLRRVYKMGVETVQNRQADSEVVERSTNTFATEKGKLRALELVEEYASLDGQDLSQFNKRAPSVDERMLMFQLMRQHVFHLENASERFLRSEGAERNAIGQEMRALEGSLDRVITGLRVASTLAGRVLRNHQVGLDSLNMLVYRMARAEREKGAPLNEDEKREIMEKFKAYEREHSRLTEELNQMEKQYQSERMAKEIAEREFAVAKEAIAKLGAFKEIEKDVLGSLDIPVTGIMFKITPEEDAAHLDAVEAGDMEAAQRMVDEAAKKAGYDPSYLHGTQNKFDIQDLREGQGILRRGLYLTQVPEVADNYGTPLRLAVSNRAKVLDLSDGASLLQYMQDNGILDDDDMSDPDLVGYIESGRPFQADPFNRSGYMDQVMDNAETDGYQVVRLLDDLGQDEEGNIATVVLDRSVLKSADAVTYDDAGNVIPLSQRFNAETPDIRFKLPGVKLSEVWAFPEQEISSADTSINNRLLPASFKRIAWRAGTINADIGGGRFDNATEFLASQGVQNVIYDPFNRTPEHNRSAIAKIAGGKAQTATVNNVLNVIREPAARLLVIRQAADAVGPDGTAYFLIYEGAGDGVGRQTSKGWQENRKASDYEAEIRTVFGNVKRKGNMLVATDAGAVAAPRFKLPGVTLSEAAREYLAAAQTAVDNAPTMVEKWRALDEWKSANPEAAQDADTGEAIQGRAGMRYRSFDSPDEATGIDRSSSTRPFLHGGAYEIEYSGTAKPIGPSQPEGGRGTIDPASVTRVFYEPEYWTPETRAQQLASDLPQLRSMFPNAEFVAVRLADDAETRVASPLALRPDGTLAGVQEQADPRFKLPGVTLDAEYMEAVEKGDMETAQRMVDDAAKRAGYTIGPVYHGTRTDFNIPRTRGMSAFDEKLANVRGDNDAGMFFSNVRDTARDFAQRGRRGDHRLTVGEINNDVWPEGARIVNAYLKLDNPKEFDGVGDFISYRNKNFNRIQDALREEGHNGIVLRDASYDASNPDETWYIATDPSQIKSAEPVTYDDAGNVIPLSERFNEQSDDIRYKITPDPMSLEEIQSRVSTGQLTAQEFVAKFAQEALARGYEPEEVKAYLKRVLVERGAKEKPGVKQQQPKQPIDPKKAKVPYNDKEGNPEPKKVAKYAWALSLKEYGDMHGFELEEMSKEHLYGVIDNAVNIANEIMGVEIFDREQLIRLTTGYGKVTEKKRTEFDRALSKTRSMLLSLARINDLAYGNRAKKVETDRLKTVPLMRELAQEVLNMLDRGVATGILPDVDIETVKDVLNSRFDNMRRALKMAIQELAQAIERGTPTTRGEKQEYEDPPDIKELKRIKKELQAVHDAMPAVQERKKARYLENRVTNLKKQISALDEKIEKAKQGVFETVEKKARPTTQEINDLTAERDGKKKELRELEANDLGQQAKRYEEAMKRLQEVGQQLTEALEAGETIPHKDTEPLTEKQLQLEARRRANTELRKQLRDNWALENEDAAERISLTRQLNTLLRQESRLQRLISDKDFQPRVTKDPPVNWQIIKKRNQIAALRSKYEMEARNLEYRMSGFKGKVKAHWETADTVARMWKTWADVSAFVQTGLLAAGHPILASRAFMDATSNAWSERHYIEFWQKIEQDPFYQAFIVNGGKAHQEVDVYQGGNAANVLVQTMKDSQNKVTSVVGQGIDMSQKHFNILVSMMRFYAFKSIVAGQNLDINNKEHAIQLKQIANMVNQLGGAGTMPGKNLKKAFWSSAMMAAQIATATGGAGIIYNATLKGEAGKRHVWYEATPGAWKEALRIHAGLLAANLLMNVFQMMMAKLSGDDDPELGDWEGLQTDSTWDMMWRLYSRTFGPQKVGKTNILINGAYPILRLMHETAKTLTDYDTETSKTRKIGGELARFASGRANPLMSDIVQLLLGRDYMGEPYGPMIFPKLFENKFAKDEKKVTWGDVGQGMVNMTINTLVPLAQRDLIETTVDVAEEFGIFGLMAAPVTMSLAMMGWAKSTYPVSHTRQRFEVEKIMRDYERIKKEGTGDQQAEYRERYGWVVRNEKGFKSHIKRMRDARKSGDEDKIRETGRDFYHYYIGKTERSGVGALW